jgi:hypothetical protein
VRADEITNLREVHIGEASVVRPTGCHHHVVDYREVTEEPIQSNAADPVAKAGGLPTRSIVIQTETHS